MILNRVTLKPFTGNFDLPSSEAAKQSTDQPDERQIVIEKNQQGETRSRGFDLQPVVVTDDWVSTKDGGVIPSEEKLSSLNENSLALLSVNKDKEDFKKVAEFLKIFKNFTKKNNLLITNILNETYDFTNIILILQPGVISQQELELYLEDLNLLESKVIGFIYIET